MRQLKLSYTLIVLTGDRLIISCITLVMILSTIFLLQSNPALAASRSSAIAATGFCSNPVNSHCYAQRTWSGGTPGAFTELAPYGSLSCSGCPSSGFITQEMWFADTTSSLCTAVYACWIEGGIATFASTEPNNCNPGHDSICMFWADNRPSGGQYHEHAVYTLGGYGASLDPYWIDVAFHSAGGNYTSTNIWNVSVYLYDSNGAVATFNQQSTNNQMTPTTINIGSEVSNTNASTSDHTDLTYNQWACGSSWCYQTTTGTNPSTNPPPNGSWSINPCNCPGNTGGAFTTYDH